MDGVEILSGLLEKCEDLVTVLETLRCVECEDICPAGVDRHIEYYQCFEVLRHSCSGFV